MSSSIWLSAFSTFSKILRLYLTIFSTGRFERHGFSANQRILFANASTFERQTACKPHTEGKIYCSTAEIWMLNLFCSLGAILLLIGIFKSFSQAFLLLWRVLNFLEVRTMFLSLLNWSRRHWPIFLTMNLCLNAVCLSLAIALLDLAAK